jgi:hypothetical protein
MILICPFSSKALPRVCSCHSPLNRHCSQDVVVEDMKRWVAVVNPQIQAFVKYYADKKLEH